MATKKKKAKKTKGNYSAVAAYRQRQRDAGNCLVEVWIPEGDKEALKKYCEKKRKLAGTEVV